jgi:hypothetical protein
VKASFWVSRRDLWVSRIRGCADNGCLSARKRVTFWSAAACRRFVPHKLRLVRKRDRASRTPNLRSGPVVRSPVVSWGRIRVTACNGM